MDDMFELNENEVSTESSTGNIKISNDVIAAIAGVSSEEIEGVAHMYTSLPGAIAEKFANKKSQSKGVKVVIGESGIQLDLYIVIDYGFRIKDVATAVQSNVKNNVETMTGMDVIGINVHVEGVSFNSSADEESDVKIIDEN